MAEYTFRLAARADRERIVAFMRRHWGSRHPLMELPDFFGYYYDAGGGRLRFALAEQAGALAALAGFVPASAGETPDVWVSVWVADPARKGSGLELMAAMSGLVGCRTLACNNIRPETRPFYDFLGYTTGRVRHFYRLAGRGPRRIARVAGAAMPRVEGDAALRPLESPEALRASGFVPPVGANPYKDLWYIERRYYAYPRLKYEVYAVMLPGQAAPAALLAARLAPAMGSAALRIVDFIGPARAMARLGPAIDGLIARRGAEYADIYCAGLPAGLLPAAGFVERLENSADVIPTYLDPPVMENIEYYYFTNRPEDFTLFKADGDQDRPNIEV
jgi:hypothetical protein